MGSQFESRVRERQQATPWASVSVQRFLTDVVAYSEGPASLSVVPRPEVASRLWWTLEWTSADGQMRKVEAQTCEKLLWRAAEVEMQARTRSTEAVEERNSNGTYV